MYQLCVGNFMFQISRDICHGSSVGVLRVKAHVGCGSVERHELWPTYHAHHFTGLGTAPANPEPKGHTLPLHTPFTHRPRRPCPCPCTGPSRTAIPQAPHALASMGRPPTVFAQATLPSTTAFGDRQRGAVLAEHRAQHLRGGGNHEAMLLRHAMQVVAMQKQCLQQHGPGCYDTRWHKP